VSGHLFGLTDIIIDTIDGMYNVGIFASLQTFAKAFLSCLSTAFWTCEEYSVAASVCRCLETSDIFWLILTKGSHRLLIRSVLHLKLTQRNCFITQKINVLW
jgi:hypothetical protein